LSDAELGVTWSRLPDGEKDRREASFFRLLLEFLSNLGDARFSGDFPFKEDLRRLSGALLPRAHHLRVDRSVVSGPLVSEIIQPLVASDPAELEVTIDESVRLELHDSWTGVRVGLEDDELQALLGILRSQGLL
jgi:hypothetical protein